VDRAILKWAGVDILPIAKARGSMSNYVKDVVFKEYDSKIRKGEAPLNLSVFRNFAISIYRNSGYSSIKEGIEVGRGNFDFLAKVLK
jgi:hypothetical protein